MTLPMTCCVPDCGCRVSDRGAAIGPETICSGHFRLASAPARARLDRARARLEKLQSSWESDEIFERVTARGRYPQFCALIAAAHDHVDRAWENLKLEIMAQSQDHGRALRARSVPRDAPAHHYAP